MESCFAYIQNISITHLRGPSEGNDAAQIGFRANLSVEGVQIVRTVLKAIARN